MLAPSHRMMSDIPMANVEALLDVMAELRLSHGRRRRRQEAARASSSPSSTATQPAAWFRAPGRVDLMGSHTDYNDGYVATMTVDRDTWIAIRPRDDRRVRIASLNLAGTADFSLDAIEHDAAVPWTDYVRGAAGCCSDDGADLAGFDGLLHSTVPFGSGLSSSAAIETATLLAFGAVSGIELEPLELALLGQRVENEFVGVSCGILDQYTSVLGTAGHALLLDCRALTSRAGQHRARAGGRHLRHPGAAPAGRQRVRRAASPVRGRRGPHRARSDPGVRALRDVSLGAVRGPRGGAAGQWWPGAAASSSRRTSACWTWPRRCPAATATRCAALFEASFEGATQLFEIGAPSMTAMHEAMAGAPGLIARRQAGAGFGGCLVAIVERARVEAFAAQRRADVRGRHRHRAERLRRRGLPWRRAPRERLRIHTPLMGPDQADGSQTGHRAGPPVSTTLPGTQRAPGRYVRPGLSLVQLVRTTPGRPRP